MAPGEPGSGRALNSFLLTKPYNKKICQNFLQKPEASFSRAAFLPSHIATSALLRSPSRCAGPRAGQGRSAHPATPEPLEPICSGAGSQRLALPLLYPQVHLLV